MNQLAPRGPCAEKSSQKEVVDFHSAPLESVSTMGMSQKMDTFVSSKARAERVGGSDGVFPRWGAVQHEKPDGNVGTV